jgi:hypothetical protein
VQRRLIKFLADFARKMAGLLVGLADLVLFHPVTKRVQRQPQQPGGFGLIANRFFSLRSSSFNFRR